MITTPKIALVTGATQGLGLALVEGLAQRMTPADTVYLTGRHLDRVTQAVEAMPGGGAQVRGEFLDDVVDDALASGMSALWFQLGLGNADAARRAESMGIRVVWDRCTAIEHRQLRLNA